MKRFEPGGTDDRDDSASAATPELFGHAEAEQTLLDAYRSGRIPHAWLIGGESGIGKATLAYRMARFVLAHPDPAALAVQKAKSLAVPPDHPVARRIAGQAHSDLLVLERILNDKTGKLFTVTRVDDVRRTVPFFGSTAGEGGWRVAIVDPLDDLNRERRERAAQGAGGAAAARAAAARQSCARPRARHHPLALPHLDPASARRRGRRPRRNRGDGRSCRPGAIAMPPPPPTARSGAR